ncbi:MAG: putative membrane protein [Glaciecola sp.]|jgi:uncharacterized membrane protein
MTELPIIAQLHLAVGTLAVVGGFAAMLLPKGKTLHKFAGKIFFYTMLALCFSGIYLTFARSLQLTLLLAIFSLYLLLTGWYAMARKDSRVTVFDKVGFYVISTIGIATLIFSILGWSLNWHYPSSEPPYPGYLIFVIFSAFLAYWDYQLLVTKVLVGTKRLIRHLWRMHFALLIATFIFFGGNSNVLPEALRTDFILMAPIVTVLTFMFGWLVYVKVFKKSS